MSGFIQSPLYEVDDKDIFSYNGLIFNQNQLVATHGRITSS
jgi:hypothetical protein